MIIWRATKTFTRHNEVIKKGYYLITANYRKPWFQKEPLEIIGQFQAYWGARPCVVKLTPKAAESWIENVNQSSLIIYNKIRILNRRSVERK